jgi:bifunctional non-homologous end joining protein LigD
MSPILQELQMNENLSITLYSTKDGADKEYRIQLEAKGDGFIVTGFNGRRGAALKPQPKISSPIPYAEAKKAYDDLLKSKLKGSSGYHPGQTGVAYETLVDVGTSISIDLHLLKQDKEENIGRYLTDDRYLAQEKYDGERRPVCRREGVLGGNKNGLQVPLPKPVTESLLQLPIGTELDAEQIGDTIFVFDAIKNGSTSLRSRGCLERMQIARELVRGLGNQPHVVAIETAVGTEAKRALYVRLRAERKEGMVFKLIDSAYGVGKNDDQIKIKFIESATVQVASKHPTKRSVTVQVFDSAGQPVQLGSVTIPANYPVPTTGAIVEVEYLYMVSSLVQTVYRGIRTDQTLAACNTGQLKYKAGLDDEDAQEEAAQPDDLVGLSITEVIKKYGLEALRGRAVTDGGRRLFIHDNDIDAALELWADEPEKACLQKRFYGSEIPNDPMLCVWIYGSFFIAEQDPQALLKAA